jgi:tRNA(Ile)-lysidine synthase
MIDVKWLATQFGTKKVLLGISGGPDSICLLDQISKNRDKFACTFKVLHIDHQIDSNSAEWAKLVEDYCISHSIQYEVVKVDITKWGNNLEQAARRSRYNEFSKQDCKIIVLAHHANDQVETFFLKLFRGSGPKGLRCMSVISTCWFDDSKTVIRPLLNYTKDQLEEYVKLHNLRYVTDPSNQDITYDRNWIRQCLVPIIQQRNNIADINIRKAAEIQNEVYNLMNDLAEIDYNKALISKTECLDWTKIKTLSLSRIKNLIMYICAKHNVVDLSIHHIENFSKGLMLANIESKNELRLKNFTIVKVANRIFIKK